MLCDAVADGIATRNRSVWDAWMTHWESDDAQESKKEMNPSISSYGFLPIVCRFVAN